MNLPIGTAYTVTEIGYLGEAGAVIPFSSPATPDSVTINGELSGYEYSGEMPEDRGVGVEYTNTYTYYSVTVTHYVGNINGTVLGTQSVLYARLGSAYDVTTYANLTFSGYHRVSDNGVPTEGIVDDNIQINVFHELDGGGYYPPPPPPPVIDDIPDEPPPLADIPEEEPPLADIPEEEPPLADIPDAPPPLADIPQTSDDSSIAILIAIMGLCLGGITLINLPRKKKIED
jgi:hypothetical protein